MPDSNEERTYSQQEVLSIASKMLAIKAQDMTKLVEGKDLSDLDSLSSFLKATGTNARNKEYDKGAAKHSAKKESRIKEIFNGIEFGDMEYDDMLIHLRDVEIANLKKSVKNNKSNKSTITFEDALSVDGVKALVDKGKSSVGKLEALELEFSQYKSVEYLMQHAISALDGAQWSDDPVRKARQIQSFKNELKDIKFKKGSDGLPIILDDEGINNRRNRDTGEDWGFSEFIKQYSPVDFGTTESNNNKNDKATYTPDNNNNSSNGSTFGFNKAAQGKLNKSDWDAAKAQGETAKADYIENKMVENATADSESK